MQTRTPLSFELNEVSDYAFQAFYKAIRPKYVWASSRFSHPYPYQCLLIFRADWTKPSRSMNFATYSFYPQDGNFQGFVNTPASISTSTLYPLSIKLHWPIWQMYQSGSLNRKLGSPVVLRHSVRKKVSASGPILFFVSPEPVN